MSLLIKECKIQLCSIVYIIFVICLVLFYMTQMGQEEMITEPVQGQSNYGDTYSSDENVIMKMSLDKLHKEYKANGYVTYPYGFYKVVKLNKNEQRKIKTMIDRLIKVESKMDYSAFVSEMEKIDKTIGGGSYYREESLFKNAVIPMSYEEALEEYHSIVHKDHITGAYMRLFCDYLGILLGILPVFLAVNRCMKDKNANAEEVIFLKRISTIRVIGSRYLSIIVMTMIPVIVLGLFVWIRCELYGVIINEHAGILEVFTYILGWILPTVMVATSVGFSFTMLTNTHIAIPCQFIWWFISIFLSSGKLVGAIGFRLFPRFNTIGEHETFQQIYRELAVNRVCYTMFAIILLIVSIFLYNLRRKGVSVKSGKVFQHNQSRLEV